MQLLENLISRKNHRSKADIAKLFKEPISLKMFGENRQDEITICYISQRKPYQVWLSPWAMWAIYLFIYFQLLFIPYGGQMRTSYGCKWHGTFLDESDQTLNPRLRQYRGRGFVFGCSARFLKSKHPVVYDNVKRYSTRSNT